MRDRSKIDLQLHEIARVSPSGYYIGLHIRLAAPMMAFVTYPQGWIDHYTEQAFALRDPTIAWGFSATGAARWSEMGIPDPFHILDQAAKFGMKYGAVLSCGLISSRTIASVTRPDREFTQDEIDRVLVGVQRLHDMTEQTESLTKAQKDALRLIAAGDRHSAAAAKLGISESALKARLLSARQRLMARTLAEAIQRAKDSRLL